MFISNIIFYSTDIYIQTHKKNNTRSSKWRESLSVFRSEGDSCCASELTILPRGEEQKAEKGHFSFFNMWTVFTKNPIASKR